ncbi:hypothetical protein SRABI27_05147 [Pedobacter sp. Bi27]|nr:hypothetical protein SRABI27_05147 [Pedobacter sp. Bi27]
MRQVLIGVVIVFFATMILLYVNFLRSEWDSKKRRRKR